MTFLDKPGGIACPYLVRWYASGHDGAGPDDGVFADFDIVAYYSARTHEGVIAYLYLALSPHDAMGTGSVQ